MIKSYARSSCAATALPVPERQAPEGEALADVCVGGGYTGLSTALRCAEARYDTVLHETERIG